jgi:hypothetical protein
MFFTVTEFVPAICMGYLVDTKTSISRNILLFANIIAISHIYLALEDQGYVHLILGTGNLAVTVRDFFMLVGDLVSFCTISYFIGNYDRKNLFWTYVKGIVGFKFTYWVIKTIYGYDM